MSAHCHDPVFLEKGRKGRKKVGKTGKDFSHGQIITYECTTKRCSLVRTPQLTCNDGSWDSQPPQSWQK